MAPWSSTHLPLQGQAGGVWSKRDRKSDCLSESPKRESIGTMLSYHLQGENEYSRPFYNARWLVWEILPWFVWVAEEKFPVFLSYAGLSEERKSFPSLTGCTIAMLGWKGWAQGEYCAVWKRVKSESFTNTGCHSSLIPRFPREPIKSVWKLPSKDRKAGRRVEAGSRPG